MTRNDMQAEINACKSLLNDTDYNVLKIAEGLFACDSAVDLIAYLKSIGEDIRQTIERRKKWRATINEMEERMALMPEEEWMEEPPVIYVEDEGKAGVNLESI